MKDKEPKIHPLVKLGSTLGIVTLAVSQVGCKAFGIESPPPEGTQTRSTEVVPPPISTIEATAPVSIQSQIPLLRWDKFSEMYASSKTCKILY